MSDQELSKRTEPLIVSPPPGPKVKQALDNAGYAGAGPFPIVKRASGVWMVDLDDNVLYDFISGRCTVNVGHRHPHIVSAVEKQLNAVTHATVTGLYDLERKLMEVVPGKERVMRSAYALSGSAANDAAMKLARFHTGRRGIICFAGAYHGVTYGALSVSSYVPRMVKGFGRVPEVFHFPYPDYTHFPGGLEESEIDSVILGLMEQAFETYLPPQEVAAVVVEPVAGDAGWLVPSGEFMRKLARMMEKEGILFMAEEVQTGFGRMGKWFGIEHYGIVPDITIMGKAMGGGAVAMAGILAGESLFSNSEGEGFYHGHTMGRHPLGVAAALANIEVIEKEKLVDKSRVLGGKLLKMMKDLGEEYDGVIRDVRGVGMLIGVEIANKELAQKICIEAYSRGLYVIEMGYLKTGVLRVAPPLISTEKQLETARNILEASIKKVM